MNDDPSSAVHTEKRRLAAIMFTDMVDFSRQMGTNEAHTLHLLATHNQVIEHAVATHQGHVIKTAGDGFLIEFPSVVHAVQCAQSIQAQFHAHNAEQAQADQIHVRIGLHEGDILAQANGDVLGDGVNVASRLQTLAEPDTVCISQKVYEEVAKKIALGPVISLGRPKLKNIAPRFPVYALLVEPPKGVCQMLRMQRFKFSRRVRPVHQLVAAGLLLVAVTLVAVRYLPVLLPSTQPLAPSTQPLPLPDKPSIVVLPFVNMSNDPDQEHFSDGITEDITSDLSRIASLFVIARNSAFTYKGKAVKVQDVSRDMGVHYVLEGSVRKADNQVRVTAQLIDATTGGHLWSERYDRPLTDIFALQDEIVQKIVTTLNLQLTLQEQGHIVRKRTDNLEAYDTFLRGVEYYYRATKEGNAQARPLFEKTITLDPQYAEAYAWLGYTYLEAWIQQWTPDPQTLQQALALGQQALALDDSLPRVHFILGWVYAFQAKYEPAMAAAERAIALDPNNADGYYVLAGVLNVFGARTTEAIELLEKAIRLNPRYPFTYALHLGWAYNLTGRYEEAIAALKQALLRNPNWLFSHLHLFFSYRLQWSSQLSQDSQTLDRAFEAAQRMIALEAASPWSHVILSQAYLWKKQYEQVSIETEQVLNLNPTNRVIYADLANTLSYLGRSEEALGLVEKALRLNPRLPPGSLFLLGHTYYLAGRTEEAIAALKKSLNGSPADLDAHLLLAAVYSELGRDAEAQAEAAAVLRINPHWSLEVWKQRVPYKDPAMLERVFAALRKAGLK